MDEELYEIAYHEAGHAVTALVLTRKCFSVQIHTEPIEMDFHSGTTRGHGFLGGSTEYHKSICIENHPWFFYDLIERMEIENNIIILLAGGIAGAIFKKEPIELSLENGGALDTLQSLDELEIVSGDAPGDDQELTLYLAWLWARTINLVKTLWEEITIVADALLERKNLNAEQIKELLIDSPNISV